MQWTCGQWIVLFAALCGAAPGQGGSRAFEQARRHIEAGHWSEALDVLLEAKGLPVDPNGLEHLASLLSETGDGLFAASQFDAALQAYGAALGLWENQTEERYLAYVVQSLSSMAACASWLDRTGEALAFYERAMALLRRLHGTTDHPDSAVTLEAVAQCLEALGRAPEALPMREEAVGIRRRLCVGVADTDLAQSLHGLGQCLAQLRRASEALPYAEAALSMRRWLHGGADHVDVVWSLHNVADCLCQLGRSAEALPLLTDALASERRLYGDDSPLLSSSLNNIAHCLESLGRAREALPLFEMSLALFRQLRGNKDDEYVATALRNVALCLFNLGRASEALPKYDAALAMEKRLHGDADHPDVAFTQCHLAGCLRRLSRTSEALVHAQEALAMLQRCFGGADHPWTAHALRCVADCVGTPSEALAMNEAALAMYRRLHGAADHPDVASSLAGVASSLVALGRPDSALPMLEASLEMHRRLLGEHDHPKLAEGIRAVAICLESLGRMEDALSHHEASLAMLGRIYEGRDHPTVAAQRVSLALCLRAHGRVAEALPMFETARACYERLYGGADHHDVASSTASVASCLESLGRIEEALPLHESVLAMRRRLVGPMDDPRLASDASNLGHCLSALGRPGPALAQREAALAMLERLYGVGGHPDVAIALTNLGADLAALGRGPEAMERFEAALAAGRSLHGHRPHPLVALCLGNVGYGLQRNGRLAEAVSRYEEALGMHRELWGEAANPERVTLLNNLAHTLQLLHRREEALACCTQAVAMIEQLRNASRVSTDIRQSFFDHMKRGDVFERLQVLAWELGRRAESLAAAERSRGRELLDLLEQRGSDAFEAAMQSAVQHGDAAVAARLPVLRQELDDAEVESNRLFHRLSGLDEKQVDANDQEPLRRDLVAQWNVVIQRRRQLLDERTRLLGDALPVGRVRTAGEIQASLQKGELLLEFTVSKDVSMLYVLAPDGQVEVLPLHGAHATVNRTLPIVVGAASRAALAAQRGRDPDEAAAMGDVTRCSHELFATLIPGPLWSRIRSSRRVFVAAHRSLHRLPFELLVTGSEDGKPVLWLDAGPPIAYVPSGSTLQWLRSRSQGLQTNARGDELVAIGDPGTRAAEAPVPEQGAFVVSVQGGGQGECVGLRPRDVLMRYDGVLIRDQAALCTMVVEAEMAIQEGTRSETPIPVAVWRAGEVLDLELQKGRLGIQVASGSPRLAYEESLNSDQQLERFRRAGDLERIRKLPRLVGADAEVREITAAWLARGRAARHLLGAEATETASFQLAAEARYLHFACHGIAEEHLGQSLSMLVLAQLQHVQPDDDGLLKLGDLLQRWRGRLEGCQLVVLSACRTNIGPTLRDEAPQALPIGFHFSGVPSVISSLWSVADASTRELMVDFYNRLLAGETDKLRAFTDAKQALRRKYPDPFHWAPFLFLGSPE